MSRFKIVCQTCVAIAGLLLSANTALAGGPENVLLVVNANSDSSLLLANHYISLREIPEKNVVYLDNVPGSRSETCTLASFRTQILLPIVEQIEERKLANIDYIVYSSDFPALVKITPHVDKLFELLAKAGQNASQNMFKPHASITSVTYFARQVLADDPNYLSLSANTYYRVPANTILTTPFQGEEQTNYLAAKRKGNSGDYKGAIEDLTEIGKRNPNQVAVVYSLAQMYAQDDNAQEAAKWLARAAARGWVYRAETESDKAFTKVMEDPFFRGIVNAIPDRPFKFAPAQGFKSQYCWAFNGSINGSPKLGRQYFLSTVLGVTRNYGCTEREALAALKRNAVVDGTHPQGTFYFADTKDVRNRTRKPNYKPAIDALRALGHQTRIINTKIPMKQDRIMGLTNGTASFHWNKSGSTLLPGAICDNLTSHGGRLNRPNQTKCTAFIAAGAAGASGTVIEPYAVQAKFPHPMIHAHYAEGCTLAEAFYQSVHGPFQLLIVGDAICQPFATLPSFEIEGLEPRAVISGEVKATLDFSNSPVPVGAIEIYLNGNLLKRTLETQKVEFDSQVLPDGYHELRIVPIAANLLKTTKSQIFPIVVDNKGQRVNVTLDSKTYKMSDTITVEVESNCGDRIVLKQNYRELGSAEGQTAKFKLPAEKLGRGPVRLTAISVGNDGSRVSSVPYAIEIVGPISDKTVKAPTPPKK